MSNSPKSVEMSDGHRYWNGDGGDTWARTMDVSERNFASMTAALKSRAAAKPGEQVLDVGCGGGVTCRELAEQVLPGGAVVGMDISATILDIAAQRHGGADNLSFTQADIGTVALPAEQFDLVYSRFGVMFFDEPPVAFRNLRNALKASGRLVFMCWRSIKDNPWIYATTAAAVAQLPEEHRPAAPADPFAPGPFALADEEHTRQLLTGAGYKEVKMEPLGDVMRLADVDTALEYLLELGPVGNALKQVPADRAKAAERAMREVLQDYTSAEGLNVPSATWIVTARP